MAANPYAAAPLYVAQVDPSTGRHVRAFFFLGAVPKAVLAAARRALPGRGDARRPEWAPADGATLRGYYGGHWRELLTPADPPPPDRLGFAMAYQAPAFITGGAAEDIDFGNLEGIDDIDNAPAGAPAPRAGRGASQAASHAAAAPEYTDLAVYGEDTVHDLRLKLCAAAGVPLYRQHLFYYVNEEGPAVPYRFTLDGAPVLADWRALAPRAAGAAHGSAVAGVAVDPRYEERREGVHIEALDTFTLLSPTPGVRVTRAYYVDLFAVLPPLGAAGRPNDGLAAALQDRYQFDLLYYGGLLRYWPQLSPDACSVALTDPAQLAAAYPALDPDPAALRARFAAERGIADGALAWRPSAAKGGRQPTAVTAATVRVMPDAARMRVAVRNVCDWIPTGGAVAAARARFDLDAGHLADAGTPEALAAARQGGLVPVVVTKRHVSSYGPRAATAIGRFVGRTPRRDSVTYALARPAAEGGPPGQPIPYVFLSVFADGRTEATSDWREDDRVSFDTVVSEIAAVVGPTIAAINAMGAAACPIGGTLTAPAAAAAAGALTTLGAITVSAFWPHALTAAAFREMKEQFRAYEKAGIVGIRGLQQAGAYSFNFRRGVVAYDPRLADRAEAGGRARADAAGAGAQNQYAWLTDASVAVRWAAAFQGRTVRIHHRVTDLRVEIVGADSLAEFEVIRRYVFAFLDGFGRAARPGRAAAAPGREHAAAADTGPTAAHRLRRLQERDPDLFDLKKYSQDATVYSVLCQSGRQPYVYNEAELGGLGERRRAAAVKYWNFTEDAPAYYYCPDPSYPHLSFRAGLHPHGHCLPCCKKTRAPAGSRAALANARCLARRAHEPLGDDESAMSRHILAYGKVVPPGRIAEPPREVGEGLFLDALPHPYRLHLVGVEQSAPAVPEAGFAYALAFAAAVGDETADEVLGELAAVAGEMGGTYHALGAGGGAAFASAGDLAAAILDAFVRRDAGLSPLGPGGAAAGTWRDILADLARHAYGVEVVTLTDPTGAGAVTVEATPDAAAMVAAEGLLAAAAPRVALLAVGPAGTYPMAALKPHLYPRIAPPDRWMAARRAFGEAAIDLTAEEGSAGPERITDRVFEVVRGVLAAPRAGAPALDLGLVTRWARAGGGFAVETRLINLNNLCYGVLLRGAAGLAYVPVRLSAYPVDGTPATFGPRPAAPLPAEALTAAVESLNRHIAAAGEPCAPVERAAVIVDAAGRAAGFATPGEAPLHFFHDAGPAPPAGAPVVRFPYDSREVDLAVAAALRGGPAAPAAAGVAALAAGADVRNRLYRLFLAEFSAVLRAERNGPLRRQLEAALGATRYESAQSVAALRRRLAEILLPDYPDDLQTVRGAVARAYATAPQDPGRAALAVVEATGFAFDRRSIARLRAQGSHGEVVSALRALMASRVTAADVADPALSNIYVSCAEDSSVGASTLCVGRRLAVPADRLDDFYDILAADVRNAGKTELLAAISAGVFDPLTFIRRPGESLAVELGVH